MKTLAKIILCLLVLLSSYDIMNIDASLNNETDLPIARYGHKMIYNSHSDEILLFGGSKNNLNNPESYLDDTWIFFPANKSWKEVPCQIRPSNRLGHEMIYDSKTNKIVLYGGGNQAEMFNDTWQFDCSSYEWSEINTDVSPPNINDPEMVYDKKNSRIILFGGYMASGYSDQTWIFTRSNNSWSQLITTSKPSARYGHRMEYLEYEEMIILFAGHYDNGLYDEIANDLWVFNCSTNEWSELFIESSPPSRYWHGIAYDSGTNQIVMFGGRKDAYGFDCRDDTWILNMSTKQWTKKDLSIQPSSRMFFSMVSTAEEGILLFGGNTDPSIEVYNDLWQFDLSTLKWIEIDIEGKTSGNATGFYFLGVVVSLISCKASRTRKKPSGK